MLRPRIIPCLLVKDKGLVKTVRFVEPKYIGDPINAVKIFNEKEVDELSVFDIDASSRNLEPDYRMIENLAVECRMPLCYGGGVKSVEQAKRILSLGVEKVAIGSAASEDPPLVARIAEHIGAQSVVVVLDVKKHPSNGKYSIRIHNGRQDTGRSPAEFSRQVESLGAGEIIINSIDNDGIMKGYDFALVDAIRESVRIPMTVLGGAGSLDDIGRLFERHGIIGAAAGSLFVFKGVYRAVLISYPSREEKEKLLRTGGIR